MTAYNGRTAAEWYHDYCQAMLENTALSARLKASAAENNAIDKHLRGKVNDPDPLSAPCGVASYVTTYGLAAGLLRERDQLTADLQRARAEVASLRAAHEPLARQRIFRLKESNARLKAALEEMVKAYHNLDVDMRPSVDKAQAALTVCDHIPDDGPMETPARSRGGYADKEQQ